MPDVEQEFPEKMRPWISAAIPIAQRSDSIQLEFDLNTPSLDGAASASRQDQSERLRAPDRRWRRKAFR